MLAGVCGTDPFRLMDVFLDEVRRIGFSGVQNFPTVGLFDGTFRQNLEETGMGYGLEVEMIRLAREKDLLTAPYVFTVDEAVAMAEAGADVLVPHMGLTTGGAIGASRPPVEAVTRQNRYVLLKGEPDHREHEHHRQPDPRPREHQRHHDHQPQQRQHQPIQTGHRPQRVGTRRRGHREGQSDQHTGRNEHGRNAGAQIAHLPVVHRGRHARQRLQPRLVDPPWTEPFPRRGEATRHPSHRPPRFRAATPRRRRSRTP